MFAKVTAGDPSSKSPARSARWLNSTTEAVEYYQNQIRLGGGTKSVGLKQPTDTIKVQNVSGGDLDLGAAVQIGAHLLDEVDSRNPIYEADEPAEPAYLKWAILTQPIEDNGFGVAQVNGVCPCLVDIIDTDHTHANPVDGETHLESGISGPIEILTLPDETGEQLLLCRLSVAPPSGTGEADAAISNGAAGNINVMTGSLTSETESGLTESMVNLGPDVVEGDPVSWSWVRGQLAFVKLCS